jgi:hypothetical protein
MSTARLMPAKDVKACVKRNKNDTAAAAGEDDRPGAADEA